MELIKVDAGYEMKPFDCGDSDLNGFLLNDAKPCADAKIAKKMGKFWHISVF